MIGALTFSFGGYLLSYPMLQLAILETAAWLPLVVWSMRRLAARGGARSIVLAGGVLAMSALAGHLGQPLDSTLLLQQGEGSDATYLYRLAEDHPRAWIVHQVEVKDDRAAIYAALAAPDFDVRRTALTMMPVNVVTNQAVEPISITRLEPNRISLEAALTTPGLLVLSEVNYPGWVATVNGVAQPVIEVDGTLRGVALGAGASQVEMTFQPASLQIGGAVSVLAVLICVVGLGWSGRKQGEMKAASGL